MQFEEFANDDAYADIDAAAVSSLPCPSDEQQEIINAITAGENVACQAMPGAGKTMTALLCALQLNSPVLLLTFSTTLKVDTRKKKREYDVQNLYVHSYHSVLHTRENNVRTISQMHTRLNKKPSLYDIGKPELRDVKYLFIDEAQDVNDTYAKVVRYVASLMDEPPIVMVIGDYFQCVYKKIQGSDPEYLSCPETMWRGLGRSDTFTDLRLSKSFRISHQMARFVNENLDPRKIERHYPKVWQEHGNTIKRMWGNGLVGNHDGVDVIHEKSNTFDGPSAKLIAYMNDCIEKDGPESLTVIMISTKPGNRSPGTKFVEKVANSNWFVNESGAGNDHKSICNEQVLRNKSHMCTISAFKGKESKHVVFFGFDQFLETCEDPCILTAYCMMYTALTRAICSMYVVSLVDRSFLTLREKVYKLPVREYTHMAVTSICAYLPDAGIELLDNVKSTTVATEAPCPRNISTVHFPKKDVHEDITALIGHGVERGICCFFTKTSCLSWKKLFRNILLERSYKHYDRQIDNMDWVDVDFLDQLVNNAVKMIQTIVDDVRNCEVQYRVGEAIYGDIDLLINDNIIIEIKTTSMSLPEHLQQVAIYRALLPRAKTCYIVNPVVGTLFRVDCDDFFAHFKRLVERKGVAYLLPKTKKRKIGETLSDPICIE